MGTLDRGFISGSEAASGNATEIAVHTEITAIESEILVQSNLGFLQVDIRDTLMTSTDFNSPITITGVTTSAIPAGSTNLTFASTTGILSGLVVSDLSNPGSITTGTTVSSVTSGTEIAINNAVLTPGVLNGDVINFARTATTSVATASGNTITFSSVVVSVGMSVTDTTHTSAIPVGTYVTATNGTVVTLSNTVTGVGSGDTIVFSMQATIVTNNTSTITVTGSELAAGTPVTFSSTGAVPTPLTTATYYLVPTGTTNVYEIAETKQNAMLADPITLTLTSIPSGTNSMTVSLPSQLYFMAWQNYYDNTEYRMYAQQMFSVINYFKGLGYDIQRLQASDNLGNLLGVFYWQIRWGF